MEELAGRVYADALLEIGKSEGKLSKFNDDLNLIAETLNSNPDIFKILNHPKVGKDQKKDVFKNMFESYVDKDIMNFLYIAVDKKRESSLQSIYNLLLQHHGQRSGDRRPHDPRKDPLEAWRLHSLGPLPGRRMLPCAHLGTSGAYVPREALWGPRGISASLAIPRRQIGRASCRERV